MGGGICALPLIILDMFVKSLMLGSDTDNIYSNNVGDVVIHNHIVKSCKKPQKSGICCTDPVTNKCTYSTVIFTKDKFIRFIFFDKVEIVNTMIESTGFYNYIIYVLYNLAAVKKKFGNEWGLPTNDWEDIVLQQACSGLSSDIVKIDENKISFLNSIYGCLICQRKILEQCICAEENKPKIIGNFNNVILYWLPPLISLDCIFSCVWYSVSDYFKLCLHDTQYFYIMIFVKKTGGIYTITVKSKYKCRDIRRYSRLLYRTYRIRHSDIFMYYLQLCKPELFLIGHVSDCSLFVNALQNEVQLRRCFLQPTPRIHNALEKYVHEVYILRKMPECYSLIRDYMYAVKHTKKNVSSTYCALF